MIELGRFAKCEPRGLASVHVENGNELVVLFKLYSPMDGSEQQPERSVLTFQQIEEEIKKLETNLSVLKKFLEMKPQ